MYKTLTTLIASNILLDFIVQAIIVERNLYSYYRLPTTIVKTNNESDVFYILQCPFKSSMNIPKPKDMPVCLIVGRHRENERKPNEQLKAKPCTTLSTQVDYENTMPTNLVKLVKIKNGKPYTMLLKPVRKKEVLYKKPKTEIKEQYKIVNIKFPLIKPKTTFNQTTVSYAVPLIQKIQINDSVALSSSKEPEKLTEIQKPATTLKTMLLDDPEDEKDIQTTSPLKYLGVADTLKKLRLTQQLPQALAANQTEYKTQKFFVDLESYKKGFHTKGFQNMYHRDEIYQDHIFYDDLQQMGNYQIKQKLQQKKP